MGNHDGFKVHPDLRGTSKPWGATHVGTVPNAKHSVGDTPGASHAARLYIDPNQIC
jgi:hypothetical protein